MTLARHPRRALVLGIALLAGCRDLLTVVEPQPAATPHPGGQRNALGLPVVRTNGGSSAPDSGLQGFSTVG